jgi:hypothetical protein
MERSDAANWSQQKNAMNLRAGKADVAAAHGLLM